jgi:site-specific DNA recombinase
LSTVNNGNQASSEVKSKSKSARLIPFEPPLLPKDSVTLRFIFVSRVSDPRPGKQDGRSLDEQQAWLTNWLDQRIDVPYKITPISGSGSGECLERDEYLKLIEEVGTGKYDCVLAEDLGRIIRRIHAVLFCEHCVDHDTRLIALNDNVDTGKSGWQDSSIFSAWHHERSNRDTSDRIKRTNRGRFLNGGCLTGMIYGYVKPPGAKTDGDLEKMLSAEPVYMEWFDKLDHDATYAEVSDWLNLLGIPAPPNARGDKWTPRLVKSHTFNTLLKGVRERNRRKSKRNNSSGKYRSIKADPQDLLRRLVPHLAFFEEAYFDRIIAKLIAKNAIYRRADNPASDPRRNVAKKRTRYPGQTLFCGICNRLYVFGAHGQTDHLMCTGARDHACWNGVSINGPLAATKISAAMFSEIQMLEDFDATFMATVNEEAQQADGARQARRQDLLRDMAGVRKATTNVVAFVRNGDTSAAMREELRLLEGQQKKLEIELAELDAEPSTVVEIPQSMN